MPILTVKQKNKEIKILFENGALLDELLIENGIKIPHACGGLGKCGKCAVDIDGDVSEESETEKEIGKRLACRTVLYGDSTVVLNTVDYMIANIETGHDIPVEHGIYSDDIGVAVDIGTTTIVVKVYDLTNDRCIGTKSSINPQTAISGDVIGRIGEAFHGKADMLKKIVNDSVNSMIKNVLQEHNLPQNVYKSVVTGNTSMLYLYTGQNTKKIATYPFTTDTLFDFEQMLNNTMVYYPPCVSAFVGADLLCAVLVSGMTEKDEVSLLCDIGTNNEIALYKDGVLTVTSTAAGPVFEGAGILHGCAGIEGAIDKIDIENGIMSLHTIGEKDPCGICGSGVIDAVAVGLKLGIIDSNGTLKSKIQFYNGICFTQEDVRAVQLAKSAVVSGIYKLAEECNVNIDDIDTFYIAGGFGSHLNVENAEYIGLIPKGFAQKAKVLGNAAIDGASELLMNKESRIKIRNIANSCRNVNLGGNERFNKLYIKNMSF